MRTGPTRDGVLLAVGVAVLTALALLLGYGELLGLATALACALVLAGLQVVPRRDGLCVTRTLVPPRVAAGASAIVRLTATNTGTRPTRALIAVDHEAGGAVTIAIPPLTVGAQHVVERLLPPLPRGIHRVGPFRIVRTDPLNLLRTERTVGEATRLVVHPLVHGTCRWARSGSDGHDRRVTGVDQGRVPSASVRDYAPGDDVRLVHWPSSARAGSLMVRSTVPAEAVVLVALDGDPGSYPEAEAFEAAVRVTASVALAAGEGADVRVWGSGAVPDFADVRAGDATALLDRLAAVRPGPRCRLAVLADVVAARSGEVLVLVTANPRGGIPGFPRFDSVTVLQVMAGSTSETTVAGVRWVQGPTSAEVVARWRAGGRR